MNILLLGEKSLLLYPCLTADGHKLFHTNEKISENNLLGIDFIVCFGYKFILSKQILDKLPLKAINLHISMLPYNKGADPNLWSFLENTPKGVTIHLIDEKLDTGDIILQKNVEFTNDDTLQTSYDKLINEIVLLFKDNSKKILSNMITPTLQHGKGSFHKSSDKNKFLYLFEEKLYDTKVSDLVGKALK